VVTASWDLIHVMGIKAVLPTWFHDILTMFVVQEYITDGAILFLHDRNPYEEMILEH
jgi:hypothetical protein